MQNKLTLAHAEYYLLRRPLLPVNVFFEINELVNLNYDEFEQALLSKYTGNPELMEAIYTASPELYAEFFKVTRNSAKPDSRLMLTLYKYLSRMSSRCTPYGLFAGCSTGRIGNQTNISYKNAVHRKESRLDMNYVNELINHLQLMPELKRTLSYSVNTSLYAKGEFYRYIEYQIENKRRQYTLASVRKSEFLESLIDAAGNGMSYQNLLDLLLKVAATVEKEEAEAFLDELIDSQILISELEPTITGELYMNTLPDHLVNKVGYQLIENIRKINVLLEKGGINSFEEVYQIINENFVTCQSKDLIQTDLFFDHQENQLSAEVTGQITSQLSELYGLSTKAGSEDLDEFKQRFYERYEDREIPLLQALDGESGVGYGSSGKSDHLPLLEGIEPGVKKAAKTTTWTALTLMVNKVFKRAMEAGTAIAELYPGDLEELELREDLEADVPSSLFVFGSVLASSSAELDAGNYQFSLSNCSGPSAANVLGRFCHGDQVLFENVLETLREDEPDDEGKIYAEIVHLPESRIGNILLRPTLRNYEIPFLGKSSRPSEEQIRIQDIMVSFKDGRIVLRSVRLNKVVIPRLSTAHNYRNGLPVYRFLCDLQKDGLYHSLYWDWANLRDSPFLPRVVYKNLILCKASWTINRLALKDLTGKFELDEDRLITHLAVMKVPRYVCIAEYDNELLIDSQNNLGRQLLYQELNKKGGVKLTEFLSEPGKCFLKDAENRGLANEILFPVSNKKGVLRYTLPEVSKPVKIQRTFIPGSEWTYFKLYGGTKTTEKVLVEKIRPYLGELIDQEIIKGWFFIRYTDPNHHIRLRIRMNPDKTNEANQVISDFCGLLKTDVEEGGLYKIQLDTYVRELERYGPDHIENSETLFYYDSVATAEILNMIEGDAGESFRWLLAARGLDELLNDFGLGLEDKLGVFEKISDTFFKEHHGGKALTVALNEQFRTHRKSIRSFLDPKQDEDNGIEEATAEFAKRTAGTKEVIKAMSSLFERHLSADKKGFYLLTSYIHMYMNRFFLSKPRQHELVLYTLMKKHYLAELAIRMKS